MKTLLLTQKKSSLKLKQLGTYQPPPEPSPRSNKLVTNNLQLMEQLTFEKEKNNSMFRSKFASSGLSNIVD